MNIGYVSFTLPQGKVRPLSESQEEVASDVRQTVGINSIVYDDILHGDIKLSKMSVEKYKLLNNKKEFSKQKWKLFSSTQRLTIFYEDFAASIGATKFEIFIN